MRNTRPEFSTGCLVINNSSCLGSLFFESDIYPCATTLAKEMKICIVIFPEIRSEQQLEFMSKQKARKIYQLPSHGSCNVVMYGLFDCINKLLPKALFNFGLVIKLQISVQEILAKHHFHQSHLMFRVSSDSIMATARSYCLLPETVLVWHMHSLSTVPPA